MIAHNLFSVPVATHRVSSLVGDITVKKIIEYTESQEFKDNCNETASESVRTTFFSDNSFIKNHDLFLLETEIISFAAKFCEQLKSPKKESDLYINTSWINFFTRNVSENIHTHSLHFISGCYYVAADELSGQLTFPDPCGERAIWNDFHMQNNCIQEENFVSIPANVGEIVLFPSWLPHFVTRNRSDVRISIAFNIDAK